MKRSFLILILVIILSSACSQSTTGLPVETGAPASDVTAQVQESPTPGSTPRATIPLSTPTPPAPSFTQYLFSVQLDYRAHQATVDQKVAYINTTGVTLEEVVLVVEPNRYPGAFVLSDLSWASGEPVNGYTLDGIQLNIPLPNPLAPQKRVKFSISYQINLPPQNAPFGYTDRQTNLGDWYPFVPPYLPDEGWLVREPAYLGEHLAYDVADFKVDFQLANPNSAEGRPLVIAASAPAEKRDGKYHYQMQGARSFALSISDQFNVLTTTVDDVTVMGYSFPYHPAADEPALQAVADALALYSELYGPYPHKSLSVVEGDFLNGMEYEGLFFLSHAFYDYFTGSAENNLIIIAAHETAHQWFYGWVGNDQALEPWLDEATTTYSEMFFYKEHYPDLLDWWWNNRVYFHDPDGWVDSTIYEAAGFYPYRDAIYLQGALFLDEIKESMGEAAFLEFLRAYLTKYRYKIAGGDDFFNLLKEHTSADVEAIAGQYFENR